MSQTPSNPPSQSEPSDQVDSKLLLVFYKLVDRVSRLFPRNTKWTAAILFFLTVLTVFRTGAIQTLGENEPFTWFVYLRGWSFAIPLLAILLFHEFGHYIAAKIHKVPASLPHFIPFPWSPFGTMGAIIGMKGRIGSRKALLDIGAAGPLAGLLVAIPVLILGLRLSPVQPLSPIGTQEGQSLLYWFLKRITVGPIPDGHDVFLHPIAFAGWVGLFLTMINLVPISQLDGGHVAYALLGKRHHRIARFLHNALPLLFLYNFIIQFYPIWKSGLINEVLKQVYAFFVITGSILVNFRIVLAWDYFWDTSIYKIEYVYLAFGNSLFWLFWFGILHIFGRLGGRDHPETDPGELGTARTIIAGITLAFFVLLFMPTPMSAYSTEKKDQPWPASSASVVSSSPTTAPSTPESTAQPSTSSAQPLGSTVPNRALAAPSQAPSPSAL